MKTLAAVALFLISSTVCFADEGHSSHGSAFDSGMRTKPWLIPGVGDSPFLITSQNKSVQQWFDQGNALLHSFWFEEAERSFRWCLKLDPDCAMAYWGLARCGFTWFNMDSGFNDKKFERYKVFLKEAVKRKANVSDRERMFIEALQQAVAKGGSRRFVDKLKEITTKFPNDIEAKALIALYGIDNTAQDKNELMVQEVLKVNPMHPGALHASIHNWDYGKPVNAIKACELYGKAAPGVGHALHMPGHIYSKIGMWHEAAIAMDSATRTELKYMNDRLALPFETWNYPHNRNYLCYIQEQLGLADVSIKGAKDLIAAPRDPELNDPDRWGMIMQGVEALVRSLVKFERWNEILKPDYIEWNSKDEESNFVKAWAETLAYCGLNQADRAREKFKVLQDLDQKRRGDKGASKDLNIAEAFVLNAEENPDEAQKALLRADDQDKKSRENGGGANDPPFESWPVARLLGDHFRAKGFNQTAISYYERALQYEPNDAFSLSGLAQAYVAKGDPQSASKYAGRLAYVWAGADNGLRWMEEVKKLGLDMTPIAETPAKERPYIPAQLDSFGPSNWQPFTAPKLEVLNYNGKPVHLEDYRGKNVLLVFFLGEACVHCVGQLKSINDRLSDFQAQSTEILAVCSATPQALKESVKLNPVKVRFLSDTNHANARRFASYDDFEEIELHSTILIDKQGKVRWKRTGGDPFMNMDFLLKELKRINK